MVILKQEAIEFISKELDLPITGKEQDWDIELSNYERLGEFIYFYKNSVLLPEEKKSLMALILASYDDFLNEYDIDKSKFWSEISLLLKYEEVLFIDLLNYWSVHGETSPENYFRITPYIRNITKKKRDK